MILKGSIGHSCLECVKLLVTQTNELSVLDLTKFKRPELFNPYKHTYACSHTNRDCEDHHWVCEKYEEKDWGKAMDLEEHRIAQTKLNPNNFNNLSGELQSMLIER